MSNLSSTLPPSFCIHFLIIARMVKICLQYCVILSAWRRVKRMIYYAEIQTALNFIEKNLDKPLTVDNIAAVAGFSKYHFHRIFRNETGWSGLWMRIDDAFSRTLVLDNMQNRPIQGTTGWNHYACVLDVPKDAAVISIGILLSGQGNIWFDNAAFQEVDSSVPTTELDLTKELPDAPSNLSFEEL